MTVGRCIELRLVTVGTLEGPGYDDQFAEHPVAGCGCEICEGWRAWRKGKG